MKKFIALFLILNTFISVAFAYNPEHIELFKQTQICEGCDFNVLNAKPETLGQPDFSDSVLTGSYFYGSLFEDLTMQRLNAREINAVGLSFHNTDLSHADFSYSDIARLKITRWSRGDHIKFIGSFLSGSDFSFTEFQAPQFFEAYMKNACLYKIIWPRADLSYAVLQSADLTYAKLQHANLEGANLTAATLSHADLSYANLLNAKITADQLKTVSSVCNAILPDGSLGICK
jgi:uncharacterized protein YjbI with pentapeptide repeats